MEPHNATGYLPFIRLVVDNLLLLTIISTVIFVVGVASNLLAFWMSMRIKKEKSAFTFLIELDCAINAINCTVGWIVLNTTNVYAWIFPNPIFISYGIGSLLGPRFVHTLDCFPFYLNSITPICMGMMMGYRALTLFDINISKRATVALCVLIGIVMAPSFFASLANYVDVEELVPMMDSYTREEMEKHAFYSVRVSGVFLLYITITGYFPTILFVLCIILRILMQYKLVKFCSHMSPATKKIHAAFMNLLTLDATVSFIYFILRINSLFMQLSRVTDIVIIASNTMPYPMFTLPSVLKGLALLYFVPYFRKKILAFFGAKRIEESPIPSNQINSATSSGPTVDR